MTSPAAPRRPRLSVPLPRTVAGRRRLTTFLVLVGSGLAGYFITCFAYPRPVFQRDHAIARVIGMPVAEAEKLLIAQSLRVKIEAEEPNPEIRAGSIVWQDPPPDLIVPQGTTVNLTRSNGPAGVPIPDVADFDTQTAIKILIAAGLKVGDIDTVPSGSDPDIVVGTRPSSGGAAAPGSTVALLVSRGPSTLVVPNVVGLKLDEARRQLETAGFRIGRVAKVERRGPPGTVVEQSPTAGSRAARSGRVDLTVTEVN